VTSPPSAPRPGRLRTATYVVFDTTFLRHLSVLGVPYLEILQRLFGGRALMPRAVELELRQAVRGGFAPSAQALVASDAIVRTVRLDDDQEARAHRLREDLPVKAGGASENLGEAEAIILAQDLAAQGVSVLVIDEGDGTIAALGRGVNALGCVYVLMLAAVEGLYTDDDAWDIYVRLVATGLGIPNGGWTADQAGRLKFHDYLRKWRAALAPPPAETAPGNPVDEA
jgi:predicted nucleic acid-binding protein